MGGPNQTSEISGLLHGLIRAGIKARASRSATEIVAVLTKNVHDLLRLVISWLA
jgi:hypothetical protein